MLKRSTLKRTATHRLRDQVWALGVIRRSGLSANSLERQYRSETFPELELPKRPTGMWAQFARAQKGPTPPGAMNSQVEWAGRRFARTSELYASNLWYVLNQFEAKAPSLHWPSPVAEPWLMRRLQAMERYCLRPDVDYFALSSSGREFLTTVPHLDALGLLLLEVAQVKPWERADHQILQAREWILRWVHRHPDLVTVSEELLSLIQLCIPRIGVLPRSIDQLSAASDAERRYVSSMECQRQEAERVTERLMEMEFLADALVD